MNNIRRFQRTAAVSGKDGRHVFVADRTNRGVFINDVKLRTFKQWKYFWKKYPSENKPISDMYRKEDKSIVQQIESTGRTYLSIWMTAPNGFFNSETKGTSNGPIKNIQKHLSSETSRCIPHTCAINTGKQVHWTQGNQNILPFRKGFKNSNINFSLNNHWWRCELTRKKKKKTTFPVRVRPKPNNARACCTW